MQWCGSCKCSGRVGGGDGNEFDEEEDDVTDDGARD